MPLELRHVSHAYEPTRQVLANIDLMIHEGDDVAVVGPSGSGKTTLLSVIGLLQTPSSGDVLMDDAPIPKGGGALTRLRALHFGWVLQTVNVLNRRTAIDNTCLGLLAAGAQRPDAEAVAVDVLERLGLGTVVDQPVNTLSGGELQRVCIARALAGRPRFLCADEPTGQLDRTTSGRVLDALWGARDAHTAIIVATHDQDVARRCRRVVRLVDGALVESSS
jgi:ABC-type lipoprotein export system ATPase subunit